VRRRGALGLGSHPVGFLPLRGPFVGSPGPGPESVQGRTLVLFFLFFFYFWILLLNRL
jgi:hypothetical protein